jgi:hypothetical protein
LDALSLIGKVLFARWRAEELLEAGPRGARYRASTKEGGAVDLWLRFPTTGDEDALGVTRARETWTALVELRRAGAPIPDPIDLEVHAESGMLGAAFEWYDEPTLVDQIRTSRAVPAAAVRSLLVALSDMLEQAHRCGVSHGDLHASDVFLLRGWNHDAGAVALGRLGLEAFIGDREVLTGSSLQRRSSRRGQRADRGRVLRDIYDLARLGCAALAGDPELDSAVLRVEKGFAGPKIEMVRGGQKVSLGAGDDSVPPALSHALASGLTRSDSPPFSSMSDFRSALAEEGAGAPSGGGMKLAVGGVGAVLAIALVGIGIAQVAGGGSAPDPGGEETGTLEQALLDADAAWFEDDWPAAAVALETALEIDGRSREALDRLNRIASNCEAKGGRCGDLEALLEEYR